MRRQHAVHSPKTEFLLHGMAGWITLGQATQRLGEHKAWAYTLIRNKRLLIERDPEIGLYLVRDNKKVLKQLKELLCGERFSLDPGPEVIMKHDRRPVGRIGRCSDKRRFGLQRRSDPGVGRHRRLLNGGHSRPILFHNNRNGLQYQMARLCQVPHAKRRGATLDFLVSRIRLVSANLPGLTD